MSRTKKHIDEVFREGLKNLSLLVSNKDLEAIDDKTSVFKDKEPELGEGPFDNFEIKVDESDWLKTKSKLEIEKSAMSQDNFMSKGFSDFELEVTDADWKATYRKLQDSKRRRVAYWWWLSAGVVVLSLGVFLGLHNWSKEDHATVQANTVNVDQNTATSKESLPSEKNRVASPKTNTASVDPAFNTSSTPSEKQNEVRSRESGVKIANRTGTNSAANKDANTLKSSERVATPSENSVATNSNSAIKIDPATGHAESVAGGDANNTIETPAGVIPSVDDKTGAQADKSTVTVKTDETAVADQPKISVDEKKSEVPASIDSADKHAKKSSDKPKNFALESNRFHYYGGLVNQLGITYRHLDKSNYPMYNSIRNSAEHPFMQFTSGFEIGVQRNNLRLSVGAQVTTQSWTSNYNYSYRVHDSIPVWDPTHTYIRGYLLTRHRDTAIHEEQVIKIQKIQIPFEFSGIWKLNSRLNLVAGGGGLLGFTTKQTGTKILNPVNNQLYYYSRLQDQENEFTFSVAGSAGLQYALTQKFRLEGSFYGNYSATSRFKPSFQAKDFPYSAGISLKILYLIR